MTSPAEAFKRLIEVLESLEIPYMVGGSLAACIYGIPRSTNDVDFVAAVQPEHIPRLAAELGPDFYADPEMIRQALSTGRMFNLIHYSSAYKFDIYPVDAAPYYQTAFARREMAQYPFEGQETLKFYVESPEDAVLAKLAWYKAGNQVSERQWSDVLDILRVQQSGLDLAYLRRWAQPLGVADLLGQALREAATPPR